MDARGRIPPPYEGRSLQAPGLMRHGPFPAGTRALEPVHPELLDNKLAVQALEIERLAGDNHRLASTQVALRHDLVTSQQEVERMREHITSIQTESEIQIRVLLDKIAKMEGDIRAGERIKKALQQARIEAKSLLTAREDLTAQIQQATLEFDRARADLMKLPGMHDELDSLRQEHQRLRATFQYEKGLNIEKVKQMQVMEHDLIGMAREVEKLRAEVLSAEVLSAEKRASAPNPYYMNADAFYPSTHMHGGGSGYGIPPPMQMGGVGTAVDGMVSYGVVNPSAALDGGSTAWEGVYDAHR